MAEAWDEDSMEDMLRAMAKAMATAEASSRFLELALIMVESKDFERAEAARLGGEAKADQDIVASQGALVEVETWINAILDEDDGDLVSNKGCQPKRPPPESLAPESPLAGSSSSYCTAGSRIHESKLPPIKYEPL